ncbi:hypothetical protein P8452_61079 [Trifolium repens]|nr:fimbrin [Trifolium repens]WJX50922.1 hypothetical protein P8452_37168 [Trifolium repens]WJX77805.1 hypothetical protein P8452_61079 [Trifolium repens]
MNRSLSDGFFFLELLSFVQHRAVNWGFVTKGVIGSRDWSYFSITSRFEVTSLIWIDLHFQDVEWYYQQEEGPEIG